MTNTKNKTPKQKQKLSWALPWLSVLPHDFSFDTRCVFTYQAILLHLQCNSILTLPGNSVRSHRIKGSVPQDCPNCNANHKSRSLLVLLTDYKSEDLMTPSSGSMYLWEWLTELRETLYLLDYQFAVKAQSPGTARWKRCIGQGKWEGCRAFMPCISVSPKSPPPWKLSQPLPLGFLWRLHHTDITGEITGHCAWTWLPSPSSLPEGWEGGAQCSTTRITWLVFLGSSTHTLRCFLKVNSFTENQM